MKIRLLTTRADRARRYEIGDEIDVPEGEAIALIKSKQAEPVRSRPRELAIPHSRGERATARASRTTERR